ncbi:MAG: PHP domain-containing protein [Alphaproteobacteria bacterium]|nr:PHP domain-containing protein [Alphaproteobacteria bacterium]
MTAFVDFGRKTQYSLKNAMGDTKSVMPVLKNNNQKYFAVSDYGECSGWVQQYFTCIKNDIIPILGMETFVNNYRFTVDDKGNNFIHKMSYDEEWNKEMKDVSDDEIDWSQIDFPIDIFARTLDGYTNIIKIHNDSQLNGIDKRPRTTDLFLKNNSKGIVALMPTPYSEISSHIYNGNLKLALQKYKFYKSIFDEVYVEIPILEDIDYKEINAITINFCLKHKIPMIPVINAHYNTKEDNEVFPIFQKCGALRGGMYYEVDYAPNMYTKNAEEVWETFKKYQESNVFTEQVMRDLFLNLENLCKTFTILDIDTSPKTPHFENSNQKLKEHAMNGFIKYGFDKMGDIYKERLDYELDNICRAGFADYFLLIEQMFDWHINKMGRIGSCGRGSAGGSLVLRCLGATKIDPIKNNLLFERFLDASRLDEIINKGGKLSGADFPDVDCFDADNTFVLTETGIKLIKEVNVGDKILTRDNTISEVERIADYYNMPVVRVYYDNWYFDCTLNHRLLIKRNDKIDYKYVYELKNNDCLVEDENTFIVVKKIDNKRIIRHVRDLKIKDKHCFRVCGRNIKEKNIIHQNGVVVHNSDFQSNAKESIKDFFAETYGKNNICSVGTIGYLHVKSTLKELGRVFDINDKEINVLTTVGLKEFEKEDDGLPLDELKNKYPDLKNFLLKYPQVEKVFSKLQGTINCWGVHAGGIIISDKSLLDQLPVRVNKGKLASCWSEGLNGRELGEMGFLKLDLLAIETLDIIEDAINLINERYPNAKIKFDDIPLEEKHALARIENKENQGVFQFETVLSLKVCKNMHGIRCFDDLASLSTLMRPAALQNKFDEKFGRRRDNEEEYFIPDCMKPYISKEYGMPIYQEGAYFFAMYMAGMDKVNSYRFMKLLYKGKMKKDLIPYWREKFISGCMKKIKHKEYDIEMENGEIKHFTEYDKIKCKDGEEHNIKEIIENNLEMEDE